MISHSSDIISNKYDIKYIYQIQNSPDFHFVLNNDIKQKMIDIGLKIGKNITEKDFIINKNKPPQQQQQQIGFRNNHKNGSGNGNGNNNKPLKDFKSFNKKETKEIIKEDIEIKINDIRLNLNKLTDKNYIDIKNKIIQIIDKDDNDNNNDSDETNILKIGVLIFEIASNNKFYSKIYANLYSDFIKKYKIMSLILEKNLNEYYKIFENIEYADSIQDYDKFCKITKINEKRKSLSTFLFNLASNSIINKETLFKLLTKLMNDVLILMSLENKTNEINELTENITILYDPEYFKDFNGIEDFLKIIKKIATMDIQKEYPSFTKKIKFKYMDIIGL
jgi:hypothetical protein